MNAFQKGFRKAVVKGSSIKVNFGKRISDHIYDVPCQVIGIRNDRFGTRCWIVENKEFNILGVGVPDSHHTVQEHRLFVNDGDFSLSVKEEEKEMEIRRLLQLA